MDEYYMSDTENDEDENNVEHEKGKKLLTSKK